MPDQQHPQAQERQLPAPEDLSYEQARDQLVQVIQQMESGNLPLESTLEVWERGEALANRCQFVLDQAKRRIEHAQGTGDRSATSADGMDPAGAADGPQTSTASSAPHTDSTESESDLPF